MKIAILGAGNMGGAIAKGLVRSGLNAADITLTRTQPEVPEDLAALGLAVTTDNTEAVAEAEVVFVAVKPWLVSTVLQPSATKIPSGALVISVAEHLPRARRFVEYYGVPTTYMACDR